LIHREDKKEAKGKKCVINLRKYGYDHLSESREPFSNMSRTEKLIFTKRSGDYPAEPPADGLTAVVALVQLGSLPWRARPGSLSYFPLSDSWRTKQARTFDWTTRIMLLFRKYYEDTAGSAPKRGH
jgi:hypothetical protein